MYNFLVTAKDGAWSGSDYTYPRGRFLEYTEDEIANKFQELKEPQINTLLKLPCLFAYEGSTEPMRLGKLLKICPRGRDLHIEYEIAPNATPIPFDRIAPLQARLDIRDWELNRTHWAIKDEDLLDILTRHDLAPFQPNTQTVEKRNLPPPAQPDLRVESVGDFVNKVLGLFHETGEVFYRGHSSRAKYRLEPSILRKDERGNFTHLDSEDRMYRELLVSNSTDFQGDIYTLDRLVRMQHYSLPTRLLDITSNPLIALYFACRSNLREEGEVIALSIKSQLMKYFDSDTASCIANLARLPKESKDAIDHTVGNTKEFNKQGSIKRLLHFIKEEKPFFEGRIKSDHLRSVICVKGKRTNNRIAFQSGAFLLFGQDASLDENGSGDIALRRIALDKKSSMLKELDQLNINDSTVFPYIENSARYIADKFRFHV